MIVFTLLASALFATAAAVVLVRVVRGPTMLDRVVAIDVLVAIVLCSIGLEAAVSGRSTTLPIMAALSLLGFVGSVSVARFLARDVDDPVEAQVAVDAPAAPDQDQDDGQEGRP